MHDIHWKKCMCCGVTGLSHSVLNTGLLPPIIDFFFLEEATLKEEIITFKTVAFHLRSLSWHQTCDDWGLHCSDKMVIQMMMPMWAPTQCSSCIQNGPEWWWSIIISVFCMWQASENNKDEVTDSGMTTQCDNVCFPFWKQHDNLSSAVNIAPHCVLWHSSTTVQQHVPQSQNLHGWWFVHLIFEWPDD